MAARVRDWWSSMTPQGKALVVASAGTGAIFGGLALHRAVRSKSRGKTRLPDLVVTGNVAQLDAILIGAGLSKAWRRFLLMTAAGESNFVSNMYLGLPENTPPGTKLSAAWPSIGKSEYEATIVAYKRNEDVWSKCPWPQSRYTTAGGLFGFLAPNAVYGYRGTSLECIDPWMIYDAVEAVPMVLAQLKRIMGNPRFKRYGDWLDLRAGMGSISRMGDDAARKKMADKMIRQGILSRLKIPTSWLYERVEPLGSFDIVELRSKLLAEFGPAANS